MKNLKLLTVANLAALLVMNTAFYFVFRGRVASHLYDGAGITGLAVVAITFIPLHWKSGIWKLTHTKADKLDERELALTHWALSESYGWFAVICLVIMLAFSLIGKMNICPQYTISIPLVASLIYLSHTLPGVMLAWKYGVPEQSE